MKNLNLCLHCGSSRASLEQVEAVPTPEPDGRWHPISHMTLINLVREHLAAAGYHVAQEEHALSKDGERYFGLLQLLTDDCDEEGALVTGLRNSHDKMFPAGLLVGNGIFICDNLSFIGEIKMVRRHTTNVMRDLPGLVSKSIGRLGDMRFRQQERVDWYKETMLPPAHVHDIVVKSMDQGIIAPSAIKKVLHEFREPRHQEFRDTGDAWRLFNSYTEVLKNIGRSGSVWDLPQRTEKLHGLLDVETGLTARISKKSESKLADENVVTA